MRQALFSVALVVAGLATACAGERSVRTTRPVAAIATTSDQPVALAVEPRTNSQRDNFLASGDTAALVAASATMSVADMNNYLQSIPGLPALVDNADSRSRVLVSGPLSRHDNAIDGPRTTASCTS